MTKTIEEQRLEFRQRLAAYPLLWWEFAHRKTGAKDVLEAEAELLKLAGLSEEQETK